MKRKPTLTDILVLLGIPLVALALSLAIRSPYHVVTTLLFYGIPAAYLVARYREYSFALKDLVYVLIVSTPFAIIADYIGIVSGLWFDPASIFATRFLGVIPLEDLVWMFAATYLVIIAYHTFLDRGKREIVDAKTGRFAIPAALALALFFALAAANPALFAWGGKYAYTILGTVFFLIPTAFFIARFPRFFKKSFGVVAYFFYVTLLLELTTTHLNQWVFTGTYIAKPFSLFGFGFVSVEELFFVGIVGPLAAIAFYEFFDDDLR